METMTSFIEHGHVLSPNLRATGPRRRPAHLDWRNEDSGLWELSDRSHYGTSKHAAIALSSEVGLYSEEREPGTHMMRARGAPVTERQLPQRELDALCDPRSSVIADWRLSTASASASAA